jgi:pimeloyl-ACP methyl ester carboxylesterase
VAQPVRQIELTTPGGRFAALEVGAPRARPVLYLHGFPDHPPTATAFLGALAARGFRVLAPWLRGYAPSVLAGPYDPDTLAADALALATAWVGPARVHLVGHDWGAAIAYAACAAAPARFERAVTLALPHPLTVLRRLRTPSQARRSWYMALFQLPGAGHLAGPRLIDALWRAWSPGFTLDPAARAALHACLSASMPAPLGYYRAIARPLGAAAARIRRAAGERIAVPTLQLHGAADGCVLPPPRDDAQRFSGAYAREVLPGLGHFLHLEAPGAIAARVARWFDVA